MPDRNERIEQIVGRLLELAPGERPAAMEAECGDDVELHRAVEAWLATLSYVPSDRAESNELTGQTVGPYKLIEQLGEGGFAVVYLAQQTAPVQREVAVKVLKAGMDSKTILARFEAERQTLAVMEHPHVARVFDAGQTERGYPYFVMEYVRGVPITEYCQQKQVGIRKRLDLFLEVCEAVEHAHQKGVIHRDLKPRNILITELDGRPVPRVIDFGIAKVISGPLAAEHTREGQALGTPEYMAPEQADRATVDVDTRADVYALGVLLYELLTGDLPLAREKFRGVRDAEIQRVLREEEPLRPSVRVARKDLGDSADANVRVGLNRRQLSRILQVDLDWIALRCLEKDRTRRYGSTSALADDVRRSLRHEPTVARPPSVSYRVKKFARRHRALAAATAAVLVVLAGASVVSTWFAITANIARRNAEDQAAITREVNEFLNDDLLRSVDPELGRGREVTVRDVLDRASENIEGRFAGKPQVEASLRRTIGWTYRNLGEFQAAESHLVRSLSLLEEAEGPGHQSVLAVVNQLALLKIDKGQVHAAEELYTGLLESRHADRHTILGNLGLTYHYMGRYEDAEPLLRYALEETRRKGDRDRLIHDANNLATLYADTGRLIWIDLSSDLGLPASGPSLL